MTARFKLHSCFVPAASAPLPQWHILRDLCAEFLNRCGGLSMCSSEHMPLSTTCMCVPKQMQPAVCEYQISQISQYPLITEIFSHTTSSCPLQVSGTSFVSLILPSTRPTFLPPLLFHCLLQRMFLTPSLQRTEFSHSDPTAHL